MGAEGLGRLGRNVAALLAVLVMGGSGAAAPGPVRGEIVSSFRSGEARPLVRALHGEPINPNACGVLRYYTPIPANGGTGWMRKVSDALVSIDCGDGYPRAAHIARGRSGAVRVFTSWHGAAAFTNPQRSSVSSLCQLRFGASEAVMSNCKLANPVSGTTEDPLEMYRRYQEHVEQQDWNERFAIARSDWASFEVRCDASREGQAQRALIEQAAIPTCGAYGSARGPSLSDATRFVTAGVIGDQCANGLRRRVISDNGNLDSAMSRKYNACVFSNYTDVGMSGGMLAAVTNDGAVCAVCVINSEMPGTVGWGAAGRVVDGIPDMSSRSEYYLLVEGQNSGTVHPTF